MLAHERLGFSDRDWSHNHLTARLMTVAALFLGGQYGGSDCPFSLPKGLPQRPAGKNTVCSPFTACVLAGAFPWARWQAVDWHDMQIYDATRLDSPMDSVERLQIGKRVDSVVESSWHLVQGWRPSGREGRGVHAGGKQWVLGHAFLVFGLDGGDLLVLQSSSQGNIGPTCDVKESGWIEQQYKHSHYIAALREQ